MLGNFRAYLALFAIPLVKDQQDESIEHCVISVLLIGLLIEGIQEYRYLTP